MFLLICKVMSPRSPHFCGPLNRLKCFKRAIMKFYNLNYSCSSSTTTIEHTCRSVCLPVCLAVCVSVCVSLYTITKKMVQAT